MNPNLKLKAGTKLWQHYTADGPETWPDEPYIGVSDAAGSSAGAIAVADRFAQLLEHDDELKKHLGDYRILIGYDFKLGNIAMLRCATGPEWEEKLTQQDVDEILLRADDVAARLFAVVKVGVKFMLMSPLELCQYGKR